jgi:cobalamin synthase
MVVDDISRHKSRYLGQLILRTIASLMSLAIFALAVYTLAKFNVSFKITFAVAVVVPVYNTIRCVAYLALYRSRPAPEGQMTRPVGGLRMFLSDMFLIILCAISAGMLGYTATKKRRTFAADLPRLITLGLQVGVG